MWFPIALHCNYVYILHHFRDIIAYFPKFKSVTWPWLPPLKGQFVIPMVNPEVQWASACKIWSKSVKSLLKYSNSFIFSIWRTSTILNLWGKFWDDRQREFDDLYHCAKFGWNCISRFDNTKVWIFCAFGLKTPIHTPFWLLLGKNWEKWNVSELLFL